jgi:hypothetical protein
MNFIKLHFYKICPNNFCHLHVITEVEAQWDFVLEFYNDPELQACSI